MTSSHYNILRPLILCLIGLVSFVVGGFSILHEHGWTGATRKNGFGCSCHSPASTDSVLVWIEGPESVRVSSDVRYSMVIAGGPAIVGGLDVAVNAGVLSAADTTTQLMNGEITHTAPKQFQGDTVRWDFFYHSPSTPVSDTIYTVGNSCNGDGIPIGDAWNFGTNFPILVTSDTTSGVRDQATIPQFALLQNFPNPFNPRTRVGLNISHDIMGRLVVYDLTGRSIAILFNGLLHPGHHEFEWNGSNAASGIYYYAFRSSHGEEIRKMLLIR